MSTFHNLIIGCKVNCNLSTNVMVHPLKIKYLDFFIVKRLGANIKISLVLKRAPYMAPTTSQLSGNLAMMN